ncbi:transcriptional regulator [Fructilactobacillus carniphilus]|nr:transcriptional regulator [Fructilactobacillus carniphilus]USS90909.1 transcriptional regulator [Fructilactobacillus carniphilus]
MAREKDTTEYKSVTMRIPQSLYDDYKKVLEKKGAIVTYDIRNYMRAVVAKDKENEDQ